MKVQASVTAEVLQSHIFFGNNSHFGEMQIGSEVNNKIVHSSNILPTPMNSISVDVPETDGEIPRLEWRNGAWHGVPFSSEQVVTREPYNSCQGLGLLPWGASTTVSQKSLNNLKLRITWEPDFHRPLNLNRR